MTNSAQKTGCGMGKAHIAAGFFVYIGHSHFDQPHQVQVTQFPSGRRL